MEYTREELLNLLKCSSSTFSTYIRRSEFKNIQLVHKKGYGTKAFYQNVTEENIDRLQELLNRKKGGYYYA